MEILSQFEGMMLIGSFFLAMVAIIFMLRKREQTKEEFLVANRCAPWLLAAFSMAATWENLYNGKKFCDTDRLQFVAGYGYKWFVVNAGYSCRNKPGVIANLRLKITDYNWLQL